MACTHVLKGMCQCPPDPVSDSGSDPTPPPAPKKKMGRPKTPWAIRPPAPTPEEKASELERQIIALTMDPEGRKLLLNQLDAQLAKASFAEFVKQGWHVIEPSTRLHWNWHHQLLCNVLQAVFFDWLESQKESDYIPYVRNVLMNQPPGSLKSKLVAVFFHAWVWLHWPGLKMICLSVNDDATMRDARLSRDLIRSKWYLDTFKISWNIKTDQDAISNFGNNIGGERLSMPSKSVVVGIRGDCLIIDDANDPKSNEDELAHVNHIWQSTQYNRVNDLQRSLRIGVQQRVHANDWTGRVLELQGHWSPTNLDGWLHVVLPAEFERERKFVLPEPLVEILKKHLPEGAWMFEDPRTEEGETIDKVRMPPSVLASERKRWSGTGSYAGQMLQRPSLAEGDTVKRSYWNFFRLDSGVRYDVDALDTGRPRPAHCHDGEAVLVKEKYHAPGRWDFDWLAVSLDCAAKKTERGSNWGILVVAGKDGRRYVLDDRTQKGDILEIVEILRETIRLWRPDKILIEDKAAGPDLKIRLLAEMQRGDMPMIILEDVKLGTHGKEERLDSCLPTIANGCVYLLDGALWLEAFVNELSEFPRGRNDDRVDSLTQVLNHYKDDVEDIWPEM